MEQYARFNITAYHPTSRWENPYYYLEGSRGGSVWTMIHSHLGSVGDGLEQAAKEMVRLKDPDVEWDIVSQSAQDTRYMRQFRLSIRENGNTSREPILEVHRALTFEEQTRLTGLILATLRGQ